MYFEIIKIACLLLSLQTAHNNLHFKNTQVKLVVKLYCTRITFTFWYNANSFSFVLMSQRVCQKLLEISRKSIENWNELQKLHTLRSTNLFYLMKIADCNCKFQSIQAKLILSKFNAHSHKVSWEKLKILVENINTNQTQLILTETIINPRVKPSIYVDTRNGREMERKYEVIEKRRQNIRFCIRSLSGWIPVSVLSTLLHQACCISAIRWLVHLDHKHIKFL